MIDLCSRAAEDMSRAQASNQLLLRGKLNRLAAPAWLIQGRCLLFAKAATTMPSTGQSPSRARRRQSKLACMLAGQSSAKSAPVEVPERYSIIEGLHKGYA